MSQLSETESTLNRSLGLRSRVSPYLSLPLPPSLSLSPSLSLRLCRGKSSTDSRPRWHRLISDRGIDKYFHNNNNNSYYYHYYYWYMGFFCIYVLFRFLFLNHIYLIFLRIGGIDRVSRSIPVETIHCIMTVCENSPPSPTFPGFAKHRLSKQNVAASLHFSIFAFPPGEWGWGQVGAGVQSSPMIRAMGVQESGLL